MDLLASKKLRDQKREEERLKRLAEEEIFKKPQKVYSQFSKRFTAAVIIGFLALLTYMFLNSDVILENKCGLMPGIECKNLQVTGSNIVFDVHNYLKEDYNITLQLEGCDGTVTNYIRPNNKAMYTFNCTSSGKVVKKEISMNYVGYSGLPHDRKGNLVGKLQ